MEYVSYEDFVVLAHLAAIGKDALSGQSHLLDVAKDLLLIAGIGESMQEHALLTAKSVLENH